MAVNALTAKLSRNGEYATSPWRDENLCRLADVLVRCSEAKAMGCQGCPQQQKCNRWWNGITERFKTRRMRFSDFWWFTFEFNDMRNGEAMVR